MLELRHLRCFIGIAQERTITQAAASLHISQPALSRTLQELEEELGQPLIIRGKPLTLTAKGELLRERAQTLLELFEHIKIEVGSPENELSGTITIAAGESPAVSFLAECLKQLKARAPKISFALKSGNENFVTAALDSGIADFGILIASPQAARYEHLILPQRDSWGLLIPQELSLSSKKQIEAVDLTNLPLIVSSQSLHNNEFSGWLGACKDKLKVVGTYNLPYNGYVFAKENRCAMLSLLNLVQLTPHDALVERPLYPPLDAQLHLVWRSGIYTSALCSAFLSVIKEQLTRGLNLRANYTLNEHMQIEQR